MVIETSSSATDRLISDKTGERTPVVPSRSSRDYLAVGFVTNATSEDQSPIPHESTNDPSRAWYTRCPTPGDEYR
jgi:hypothetical protein